MDTDNAIESAYHELNDKSLLNFNHIGLYSSFDNKKLQTVMSSFHDSLTYLYKRMNERLPTRANGACFWAPESKGLISIIDLITRLLENLEGTPISFAIDGYYQEIINLSKGFLKKGGTSLPINMETVTLYYTKPIFS